MEFMVAINALWVYIFSLVKFTASEGFHTADTFYFSGFVLCVVWRDVPSHHCDFTCPCATRVVVAVTLATGVQWLASARMLLLQGNGAHITEIVESPIENFISACHQEGADAVRLFERPTFFSKSEVGHI